MHHPIQMKPADSEKNNGKNQFFSLLVMAPDQTNAASSNWVKKAWDTMNQML